MAAPMLSKGEAKSTLGETVKQKQKKEIKKQKNVLFNPFTYKWPVIDKYFEGRILDELQSVLKSIPIKVPRRPASYFKGKKQTENEQQLSEEKKNAENKRRKLRSQIVCGVREVTRGLEKDDLDLIIVCRSTQPSIITKHLIPLAANRGCPALCIPEFNPKISPLLGMTSLVAMGFKKVTAGSKSEFTEFVTYSKSQAPPLDKPWLNRSLEVSSSDDPTTLLESSTEGGAGDASTVTDDVATKGNSGESPQHKTGLGSLPEDSSFSTPGTSSGLVSHGMDSDSRLLEDSKNETQTKHSADNKTGFLSLTLDSSNDQLGPQTKNTAENVQTVLLSLTPDSDKDPDKDGGPSQSQLSISSEKDGKSITVNTADEKAGKGVRLVFPVNGPPPFVPKKDYSHLYVYKGGESFGDSFIPLSGSKGHKRVLSPQRSTSESESAEEDVVGVLGLEPPVAKRPKHSSNIHQSASYRPAVVRTMIPNKNKKIKRKK
ncbi:uncharacterized protein LOC124277287 [Haliotis rubra]|uniref:uncharacterized protein LOC124277287 n=1 Tax=Haliotis rubra TaxID=36100 RepID=UPI001EE56384|nr:uncharacterized protein LOC124277287 [Haliotis rubra]